MKRIKARRRFEEYLDGKIDLNPRGVFRMVFDATDGDFEEATLHQSAAIRRQRKDET